MQSATIIWCIKLFNALVLLPLEVYSDWVNYKLMEIYTLISVDWCNHVCEESCMTKSGEDEIYKQSAENQVGRWI